MTDFLSKLKEKKFFNIVDKQEDTIPGRAVPPIPSQPATVSDQGQVPVCTSHAVGKGVVDILNGANLDCDQVHQLNCLYVVSRYFLLKIVDIFDRTKLSRAWLKLLSQRRPQFGSQTCMTSAFLCKFGGGRRMRRIRKLLRLSCGSSARREFPSKIGTDLPLHPSRWRATTWRWWRSGG